MRAASTKLRKRPRCRPTGKAKVRAPMSPPPMGSPPFGSRERRAARRYDLSLPIVVRVVPHKRSEPCHGRIRNISARGIYFITDEELTPGAELEFTVALPVGITQVPKFLYTLTAGCCAQKREEKTTPRTQAWLRLSKGLNPSAPNLPYRKSPGSKPRAVSLCQNDFLPAHTICGSRIVRDDGGWSGRAGIRIPRWKDSTTAQIA